MAQSLSIKASFTDFSAYSSDLDGCVATGPTREEVEQNMAEAIRFYLQDMREEAHERPTPHRYLHSIEVTRPLAVGVLPDSSSTQTMNHS